MSKVGRSFYRKARGQLVTALLARDGDRCHLCELPLDRRVRDPQDAMYVTFDHIVPRSAGGLSNRANLKLAHQVCNHERGSDPIADPSE